MHDVVWDYGRQLQGTEDLTTSFCSDASSLPDWLKPLLARIHSGVFSRYTAAAWFVVCPPLHMNKSTMLIFALLTSLWSQPLLAADDRLVLTGSSTVAPLAQEIGKRFEKLNPGVRIDVQTGGSTRGVNDARMKLADIGMVSRALKPEESDLGVCAAEGILRHE